LEKEKLDRIAVLGIYNFLYTVSKNLTRR